MATVKRRLSKQTRTTLISILAAVLIVLAVVLCIVFWPKDNPVPDEGTGSGSTSQGENKDPSKGENTSNPDAPSTTPLEKSVFVKSDKEGAFSYDLYEDYAVITRGESTLEEPVIPDTLGGKPVLKIGDNAFSSCARIKSVTLPNGLKEIGSCAFYGLPLLREITLPESLYAIGESAFAACKTLSSVTIPEGVQKMGNYALDETPFLKSKTDDFVIVGDGLLIAYQGSGGSITLPSEVKRVVSMSMCETLTALYLPMGVSEICDYALANCYNLSTILIPSSVTAIGEKAFSCCTMLTNVDLGDGLITLGNGAFAFCDNLKSVGLPETLTRIGENLFEEVTTLESIHVAPESYAERHFLATPYARLVVAELV